VQRHEDETIVQRLDTLIRLVSIALVENKKQKEQIRLLTLAGIGPSRIAVILGTTANSVKVAISNLRKVGQLPGANHAH